MPVLMQTPSVPFLDVQTLIERSHPRPRRRVALYVLGLAVLGMLLGAYISAEQPAARRVVEGLGVVMLVGLMIGFMTTGMSAVSALKAEAKRIESIEELVQLRRWEQAALELNQLLSVPTRTPGARIQALLYLSSVLGRYHRFRDAMTVQTELLDTVDLDPGTEHSLKLGLAIAMLREDHLVDAGRVMAELKRESSGESGGLTLVELYRDVRTYHAAEAIELFHQKLPQLRRHLGFRIGDAWALLAWAYDAMQLPADARIAWANALLLQPVEELSRRYPELLTLAQKLAGPVYISAPVSADVAPTRAEGGVA